MWIKAENGDRTTIDIPFVVDTSAQNHCALTETNVRTICENSTRYAFYRCGSLESFKFENNYLVSILWRDSSYQVTFWINSYYDKEKNGDFLSYVFLDENFNVLCDKIYLIRAY
jgi:hypothetical protein